MPESGNRSRIAGELLRYGAAVAAGLVIDLLVSYVLLTHFGLPMVASATGGFACGLLANYVSFEKWVFGRGRLSILAFLKVLVAAQAALMVRLAAVWLMSSLKMPALMVLTLAAGISFTANFVLTRIVVARKI